MYFNVKTGIQSENGNIVAHFLYNGVLSFWFENDDWSFAGPTPEFLKSLAFHAKDEVVWDDENLWYVVKEKKGQN